MKTNMKFYLCAIIFISFGSINLFSDAASTTKKFHLITNARQTWNKALHYCNSRGWRLAGITKKDENDQILKQIADSDLRDRFWIGGTNLYNEPYFYWMGNDAPFTFTDWHPDEPNNFHLNEKCVEIRFYNNIYKWNDEPCRTKSYFVCEERISILPGGQSLHISLSDRIGSK